MKAADAEVGGGISLVRGRHRWASPAAPSSCRSFAIQPMPIGWVTRSSNSCSIPIAALSKSRAPRSSATVSGRKASIRDVLASPP